MATVVDHDLATSKVIVEYRAVEHLDVSIKPREEEEYFDGNYHI
jgi:hypothetical protein